jgi:hypothetical protein
LIGDAHLDVDPVVAGQRRVGRLLHVEHVQDVVVLEQLEQAP